MTGSERIDKISLYPTSFCFCGAGPSSLVWFQPVQGVTELLWTLCSSFQYPCRGTHHLCGPAFVCPSQWALPAMQTPCSLQTSSHLLSSTSGHLFPRARLSIFWGRGKSSSPFRGLPQTLLLPSSRNKVQTLGQTKEILLVSEWRYSLYIGCRLLEAGKLRQ